LSWGQKLDQCSQNTPKNQAVATKGATPKGQRGFMPL
jgi:hypothetical protein